MSEPKTGSAHLELIELFNVSSSITVLEETLKQKVPPSREVSLAVTKLQEARLWLSERAVEITP